MHTLSLIFIVTHGQWNHGLKKYILLWTLSIWSKLDQSFNITNRKKNFHHMCSTFNLIYCKKRLSYKFYTDKYITSNFIFEDCLKKIWIKYESDHFNWLIFIFFSSSFGVISTDLKSLTKNLPNNRKILFYWKSNHIIYMCKVEKFNNFSKIKKK